EHPARGPRLTGLTDPPAVPDALDVDLTALSLRQRWGLLRNADMVRSDLDAAKFTPDKLTEAGADVTILESPWSDTDRRLLDAVRGKLPPEYRRAKIGRASGRER